MVLDPFSIAGIVLAVFDQLLKLGERTTKLISDAQTFTEDADLFKSTLDDELSRNTLLKLLLFEESPVYGGRTMMESFDEAIQDQIKISLANLVGILSEAESLLTRRYGSVAENGGSCGRGDEPAQNQATNPSMFDTIRTYTKGHKSPLNIIVWSLRDKKRTEAIIRNFSEANGRIHETIKLWVLASSFGINPRAHLERLRTEQFEKLKYSNDANLQIALESFSEENQSYQISDKALAEAAKQSVKFENDSFAVIKDFEGRDLLVENRLYEEFPGSISIDVNESTRQRMDELVKLLKKPKEEVFLILGCDGWMFRQDKDKSLLSLIFEIPPGLYALPMSLNRLLHITTNSRGPTLNNRISLAYGLAKSMAYLHLVKWVHQSFRSGNILLLPFEPVRTDENGIDEDDWCSKLDYSKPWLFGFERSRPDAFASSPMGARVPTHEHNIYRHPDKQDRSPMRFEKLHDIYSLGVVLLEIGLWQPAIALEPNGFRNGTSNAIRKQLQKHADRRLGAKLGNKYRTIVMTCLSGDFGETVMNDTKEDLKLQHAFRTQVVNVLENMMKAL